MIFGQNSDLLPVTKTIYLSNATVVVAPGDIHKNTSILIEAGRIQTIGGRTPVPTHARVLKCDSLYIYAGFIEGISHTGLEAPKEEGRRNSSTPPEAQVDAGNPPNDRAGITPEKPVRETFQVGEKSISEMRALGFTMAHVVPRGQMLPGQGAIFLLRDGKLNELLFKENVSLFARFSGASRMYPSTLIGVMAKWRQLFHQAEFAHIHEQAFAKGSNIERPRYDQATQAMIPVTQRELPVFFETPTTVAMSRALALQHELGFDLVLTDTKRADELSANLTSGKPGVLISLDLPADKSSDKKSGQKSDDSVKNEKKDSATVSTEPADPEKEALEARRQKSLEDYYRQAGVLAAAGVPFGFSTLSVKPRDIFPHLRKMIEYGLSEEHALAALTIHPAKLFNLEALCGTVEPGKLANLIVTTGPIFDEKTQIRYVVVDGQLFEYDLKPPAKKKKSGSVGDAVSAVGKWEYSVEIPGDRIYTGEMVLTSSDGELSGYYISDDDGVRRPLSDINVEDSRLTFRAEIESDGGTIPLEFDVMINNDNFTGDVIIGDLGTFTIDADRVPE